MYLKPITMKREPGGTRLLRLLQAGTGLVLNNILLIVWVDIFKLNEALGPLINLLITIPLNFLLNKYWAYRSNK